jgi:flagellar biosynthesis/type III secretory pathway protein FliH
MGKAAYKTEFTDLLNQALDDARATCEETFSSAAENVTTSVTKKIDESIKSAYKMGFDHGRKTGREEAVKNLEEMVQSFKTGGEIPPPADTEESGVRQGPHIGGDDDL